jgi:type IV inositol 5-phosphatase, putative
LGKDELYRNLPNGIFTLLIATWNMNGRSGPCNYGDLLLPEKINFMPDLYAIGIQEAPGQGNGQEVRQLEVCLQATIGPSHVLIHSVSLGALYLVIFLRRELIWYISLPESDVYNCRAKATNIVRTKGALSISFSMFGTTFLFINTHLSAHLEKNQDRFSEYDKICRSLNLPRNLKPLKPSYFSCNVTSRFDCVFWFGDLNFRIEQDYSEAMEKLSR